MNILNVLAGKPSFLEAFLEKEEVKLLKRAKAIDNIDRFLGVIESSLQVYGPPFWASVGKALEISEVVFLKAPFVYSYLKQTKDYNALYNWLPKEIIAATVPYGDLIDVTRAYYNQTTKFFEKQVERRIYKEKLQA